ncbi:hypothetical protein BDQ12DRAFT_734910 [Crucibulum laeve]|uniref:Uncharacterized protein n=1 Tax=Crucibulum laeve TaxID=68775 RepID=A0A5C3M2F2_9AGAR|nr:hypothetical protein BDQ12DRAFT_734910 [Crucibulum laeve]
MSTHLDQKPFLWAFLRLLEVLDDKKYLKNLNSANGGLDGLLKVLQEQWQILLRSFTSVKVEFSDPDGLRWTPQALNKLQAVCFVSTPKTHSESTRSHTPRVHQDHLFTHPSRTAPPAGPILYTRDECDIHRPHQLGARVRLSEDTFHTSSSSSGTVLRLVNYPY